jgi:hypothetical protein
VQSKRRRRRLAAVLLGCLAALVATTPAFGQDLGAALSSAEADAANAEAQVAEAQAEVTPAQQRYAAASARARPARTEARAARGEVRATKTAVAARRRAAERRIARIEADHQGQVEDHDDAVQGGIGVALAALAIAGFALAWGWFRASAPVAWLVAQRRSQAIGLCVGGGMVAVIVGAALSGASGVLGAIGVFLAVLGLCVAFAFLMARHSAQVQAARERPLLGRERLPAWLGRSIAVIAGVLCLALLVGAVFSSGPRAIHIGAGMRQAAAGVVPANTKRALVSAEARAAALEDRAARLSDHQRAARAVLRKARAGLASAQSRLAAAEDDISRVTRRIEVSERREAHRLQTEERKAAQAQACDPSYVGECLKDGIGDYDCAGGSGDGPNYVHSEVKVVGPDVFGLDANGNGIGCEGE